jgi:uncharacterized protein (TIGR02246 family)
VPCHFAPAVGSPLWQTVLLDAFVIPDAEDAMDTTPVREVNAKLEAFQKAGNAEGMGDMYTEDAVLLPSGSDAARGHEAIEAFWAGKLGSGVAEVKLTTEELVPLADDLAYEIGRYTTTPKDGGPVSGHYLVLWKKKGGEWKLHVDIFNEAKPSQ